MRNHQRSRRVRPCSLSYHLPFILDRPHIHIHVYGETDENSSKRFSRLLAANGYSARNAGEKMKEAVGKNEDGENDNEDGAAGQTEPEPKKRKTTAAKPRAKKIKKEVDPLDEPSE